MYSTVRDVQAHMLSENTIQGAAEERTLQGYIETVNKRIDRRMWPIPLAYFAYQRAQVGIALRSPNVSGRGARWRLPYPLRVLHGISRNGHQVIGVSQSADDPNVLTTTHRSWHAYRGQTLTIDGTWGLPDIGEWFQVDVLGAEIASADIQTISVGDVDGSDLLGRAPRISPPHLIQVNDEIMKVLVASSDNNTLVVKRGQLGSVATTHVTGAKVYVWDVVEPIRHIVNRQVSLMVAREGAFASQSFDGASVITNPMNFALELESTLEDYRYA